MFRIGCHLSSAKGYLAMGKTAARIGANVFQFFTRNPRGGRAKALDQSDIDAYLTFAGEHDIGPILAHASYTLNPATESPKLREFLLATMADDLDRMERTPGNLYNIHPGHGGKGSESPVETIARAIDAVLKPGLSTTLLLETMVGHGNEVGGDFEQLRAILDTAKTGDRIGVCLDTCHVYSAGYDIVDDLDGVLERFDRAIGLERLRAVHLNDSMFGLGSGKDRHAGIGQGTIGLKAIGRIIRHPALKDLPFYLETPNDDDGHGREISELKKLRRGASRAPRKAAGENRAERSGQ